MSIYLDTNVIVAAVVGRHPHHPQAAAAFREAQAHQSRSAISAHELAEVYAVLTRLPITPAVYPAEAWKIIEHDILPRFRVVSLSAKEYREALESCASKGWTGGRVYDAIHIAAARKAGCRRIYTFNVRHFLEMAPDFAGRISAP
jgi:predicted nucleic acid-binding protein